jgi:hypothetical protein
VGAGAGRTDGEVNLRNCLTTGFDAADRAVAARDIGCRIKANARDNSRTAAQWLEISGLGNWGTAGRKDTDEQTKSQHVWDKWLEAHEISFGPPEYRRNL